MYSAFPGNCSVSYVSFVYGRLWAEPNGASGKIHFSGRQTCSLYLVLWLCGWYAGQPINTEGVLYKKIRFLYIIKDSTPALLIKYESVLPVLREQIKEIFLIFSYLINTEGCALLIKGEIAIANNVHLIYILFNTKRCIFSGDRKYAHKKNAHREKCPQGKMPTGKNAHREKYPKGKMPTMKNAHMYNSFKIVTGMIAQ